MKAYAIIGNVFNNRELAAVRLPCETMFAAAMPFQVAALIPKPIIKLGVVTGGLNFKNAQCPQIVRLYQYNGSHVRKTTANIFNAGIPYCRDFVPDQNGVGGFIDNAFVKGICGRISAAYESRTRFWDKLPLTVLADHAQLPEMTSSRPIADGFHCAPKNFFRADTAAGFYRHCAILAS